MHDLGYFEESTNLVRTDAEIDAETRAVAGELAYREWHLARWSVGMTALLGLVSLAAAALSAGRMR